MRAAAGASGPLRLANGVVGEVGEEQPEVKYGLWPLPTFLADELCTTNYINTRFFFSLYPAWIMLNYRRAYV